MITQEQMHEILEVFPDPIFIISKSGKYINIFGGSDSRYYLDGKGLIGLNIKQVMKQEMAQWFISQIELALKSKKTVINQYELGTKNVTNKFSPLPVESIWYEGRVIPLGFLIDNEEVVLWVAIDITERHNMQIQLRLLCNIDPLTNAFNRRKIESDFTSNLQSLERHDIKYSFLLIDVDNFKGINDVYGHHIGDEILLKIVDICQSEMRINDKTYRVGGDEFAIFLFNTQLLDAFQFAERLSKEINSYLNSYNGTNTPPSISIGITEMSSTDKSYEDILRRADKLLYKAKNLGKKRIII